MRRRKAIAVLGGLGAASFTGVSFANSTGTSSTSIDTADSIEVLPTEQDTRDGPTWEPAQDTAGSIEAGTLYGLQIPETRTDRVWISIYYDNAGSLADAYSYLNLKTSIQGFAADADSEPVDENWWNSNWDASTDGTWTTSATANNSATLTLSNGQISYLFDPAEYEPVGNNNHYCWRIRVEEGSYYATDTNSGELSPSFYIDVR